MKDRYGRYLDRLDGLADEGRRLASNTREVMKTTYLADNTGVQNWLVRVDNILNTVFGAESPHYQHFEAIAQSKAINRPREAEQIIGILEGAKEDLEQGFLLSQEELVAGEVFDSVLEQAEHLSDRGYGIAAGVLGRVVLEDALKRLSSMGEIDQDQPAASLNQALRDSGVYGKPQWRQVQAWLDIGNSAAHGEIDDFTDRDIAEMLAGVGEFLARYLV